MPIDLVYVQTEEKSSHGDGKNVFLLGRSLVICLLGLAMKGMY